tara:strand:- start:78 stop:1019 length:942 start_codon:yes stop_codon:yes gene_type:complete
MLVRLRDLLVRLRDSLIAGLRRSLIVPLEATTYSNTAVYSWAALHLLSWVGTFGWAIFLFYKNDWDFAEPYQSFAISSLVGIIVAIIAAFFSVFASFSSFRNYEAILLAISPIVATVVAAGSFGMVAYAVKDETTFTKTDFTYAMFFLGFATIASGQLVGATIELRKICDDYQQNNGWDATLWLIQALVTMFLFSFKAADDALTDRTKLMSIMAAVGAGIGFVAVAVFAATNKVDDQMDYWLVATVHAVTKFTSTAALIALVATWGTVGVTAYSVYGFFFAVQSSMSFRSLAHGRINTAELYMALSRVTQPRA